MQSKIITPMIKSTNDIETEREGAKANDKSECDKLFKHTIVVNNVEEQEDVENEVYDRVVPNGCNIKIIYEYPTIKYDKDIIKDVKAILYNMLQEEIINISNGRAEM